MKHVVSLLLILFLAVPAAFADDGQKDKKHEKDEKKTVEDVIPLTIGNLRGHKMLYAEGWHIITSTSKALDYAKEKSIVSSKSAIRQIGTEAVKDSAAYKEAVKTDVRESVETGKDIVAKGTALSGKILDSTHEAAQAEYRYAGRGFQKAVESFVKGNLTIAKRTEEDRQELASLPGNYFKNIKNDFSNLYDLSERARKRFGGKIDPAWEKSFQKAGSEFRSEYEKSGAEPNSLMALGPILYGYLKSFYYGIAGPASKTIVKTTVAGTSYVVFLPVSAVMVTGRTVQSVGLTVYYTGKTGIEIVSPTVEGGMLAGLSVLSLGSVPVTYAAGGSVGAVNQVAFSTAGPAVGVAEGAARTGLDTAAYVGFVGYDAVKGTTKVVINQASSGVVLGYNALTAIPAHTFLATEDTIVFLGWDGPRLVIAAASGKIKAKDETGKEEEFSLGDLPAGTVVDVKKLEKTEGVKVETLSTDPAVIEKVLEKIPEDVRTK